jgi:hypothetical protein
MRAASGARAERQLADGRALEAHQRHVKEEKSQTGEFFIGLKLICFGS